MALWLCSFLHSENRYIYSDSKVRGAKMGPPMMVPWTLLSGLTRSMSTSVSNLPSDKVCFIHAKSFRLWWQWMCHGYVFYTAHHPWDGNCTVQGKSRTVGWPVLRIWLIFCCSRMWKTNTTRITVLAPWSNSKKVIDSEFTSWYRLIDIETPIPYTCLKDNKTCSGKITCTSCLCGLIIPSQYQRK